MTRTTVSWSDVAAPPTWQELASLFRCERALRNESLRSLAPTLGVTFTTLHRFEHQLTEPHASLFIAVWAWIVAGYPE